MLRFHTPFFRGNANRLSPTSTRQPASEPAQLLLSCRDWRALGLTPDLQPSTGDTTVMAYQQATDTGTMRSIVVQLSNYFPINLCYYQNQEGFPSRALLICKGAAQPSLLQRETTRILSSKDHILPIPVLSPALIHSRAQVSGQSMSLMNKSWKHKTNLPRTRKYFKIIMELKQYIWRKNTIIIKSCGQTFRINYFQRNY